MIVYGANPVLEAIRADRRRVRYVAVAKENSARHQRIIAEAREADVAVRVIPSNQPATEARPAPPVPSVAKLLKLPQATTTDHLGFIGRGEGICAMAIVAVVTT